MRRLYFCFAFASFLSFGIWAPASAASIETHVIKGSDTSLVTVVGDLKITDIEQFQTKIMHLSKAVVAFGSDGGNLLAGIRIGTMIRLRNFTTVVLDNLRCASACAIAWLGGTRRLMGRNAKIGFHAAYLVTAGEAKEVGTANALLGSYLGSLGLPERAILYITQASPNSMTWLAPEDADREGIEVSILNLPAQKSADREVASIPQTHEVPKASVDQLKQRVREFVKRTFAIASAHPQVLMNKIGDLYASQVSYYGKLIDRQAVVEDKVHFVRRWPERKYEVTDDKIGIACTEQSLSCQVSGVVEWEAHNSKANSTGSSKFSYQIKCAGADCEILAENSEVLGRDFKRKSVRTTSAPGIVRQLNGALTIQNYRVFEAFLSSNMDNVIGLKVRVEKSNDKARLQATDDGDKYLTIYLRPEPGFEFMINDGYRYEHGGYIIDGFFMVKSGGMHQGTISLGLSQVDEAQIRLSKQIKQVGLSD